MNSTLIRLLTILTAALTAGCTTPLASESRDARTLPALPVAPASVIHQPETPALDMTELIKPPEVLDPANILHRAYYTQQIASTQPLVGAREYELLVNDFGAAYGPLFRARAYRSAIRACWQGNSPAELRRLFNVYDQQIDPRNRYLQEQAWFKGIRRFLSIHERDLREAYASLPANRHPMPHADAYLVEQVDKLLDEHEKRVVALVMAYRNGTANEAALEEQVTALTLLETQLLNGKVAADSPRLLATATEDISPADLVRTFLARTELVPTITQIDELWGSTYP